MIAFFVLTKSQHPVGDGSHRTGIAVNGNPVALKKLADFGGREFVSLMISHKNKSRSYIQSLEVFFCESGGDVQQTAKAKKYAKACIYIYGI